MIKINLLPFRKKRETENIRRQLSIFVLTVVFLAAVMVYFYLDFSIEKSGLEKQKTQKEKELADYAAVIKRINEIKKKIKEIQGKLDVIKGLEKNKTGPVHLLDEISMAVPEEKLWLASLVEKTGILTLKGSAMDNNTVALFMTNLEKAEHITSVDLKSTKLKTIAKYKLNLRDFVLSCKIYSYNLKK